MRLLLFLVIILLPVTPAFAAVDIALKGLEPVRIADVYQQDGISFIAVTDAIDAVGLKGHWDAVEHVFKIRTRRGWAEISPGSEFLHLDGQFYPLQDKPRFIDGRLRVSDSFILNQLAQLTGRPIYFNNLNPVTDSASSQPDSVLERFFSFILNKKERTVGSELGAIAIDPGHGGLDSGVVATDGFKEKELNLQVAQQLAKQLKMNLGATIYLSRDGDYDLDLRQRLQSASHEDVALWLRIHAQASFSAELEGVCLFIRPAQEQPMAATEELQAPPPHNSMRLARALVRSLREQQIPVQGIFPTSRLSLGRGNLPTVQLELGYLSNPQETGRLQDEVYRERIVQALYQGVRYFDQETREMTNE